MSMEASMAESTTRPPPAAIDEPRSEVDGPPPPTDGDMASGGEGLRGHGYE